MGIKTAPNAATAHPNGTFKLNIFKGLMKK